MVSGGKVFGRLFPQEWDTSAIIKGIEGVK